MKLLLSGVTGFIGGHLVTRLIKRKHDVWAIVRPSTDTTRLKIKSFVYDENPESLITFMQKEKFDGIIHLASLFLAKHNPSEIRPLVDSNILFGTDLLESAVQSNVGWFINTGTFWQHYENRKYSPVNLYAATKQAFEDVAKYYWETSKINFVTIKLCDIFGPGDTRPKVFNLWLKISKTNEELDMSPGDQIMDISYIDNVIDGYLKLISLLSKDLKRNLNGKSFAISNKEKISLRHLAKIFENVTKRNLKINWGKREYRLREIMVPWNKGKTIPGWKSAVSLNKGIKKIIYERQ